jgi:cytochrome o ubiquinol oxidase subunit I
MTRRMQHYDNPHWQPWLIVAAIGAAVILVGIACQIIQLIVSVRNRAQHRDLTGDPWNGRTLEWSTPSPPPPWNFPVLPQVHGTDAFWHSKQKARAGAPPAPQRSYAPVEMPKNSPTGFINAFFAVVTGFALIWHIWWMVIVGVLGIFATLLVFAFRDEDEIEIPAADIASADRAYRAEAAA